MSEPNPIAIVKFGGAAVSTPDCFGRNAEIIAAKLRRHQHVVAVVSAMGSTTNELIQLARRVNPTPPSREIDMLISTGERVSCALLAMALHGRQIDAISFTGSQTGIITSNNHENARVLDVRPHRIFDAFKTYPVVIVAGFQGVSLNKDVTTLGRGGSDTSAVALAVALRQSTVEFYKNVDGIYDVDPHKNVKAKHFAYLSYGEMLKLCEMGAKVLHTRAVKLAASNRINLKVRSFFDVGDSGRCSIVSSKGEEMEPLSLSRQIYENEIG